ncbi:hypothetical protein AB6A40_010883 [Gnathostoma spinigerum]|uniref:Uncharacterized protein n=1 Tax=Gnathostoma spinigerum TaxID=75299 RepID=A0ABD6F0Q1_9BILA
MSSANRKWVAHSPLILTPPLQLKFRNTISRLAANNFGEIGSPCLTPFCIGILSGEWKNVISVEHPLLNSASSFMWLFSIPCCFNAVKTAFVSTLSKAFS